jgi:hypothetical protein
MGWIQDLVSPQAIDHNRGAGSFTASTFLSAIPRYFVRVALFAWLATCIRLVRQLVSSSIAALGARALG